MELHERVWYYGCPEVRDSGTPEPRQRHASGVAILLRAQTDHGGPEGSIRRQVMSAATGHDTPLLPITLGDNISNKDNKNNNSQKKKRNRNNNNNKRRTNENDNL